ncbi:chemokine XC receptor 1-like [Xyrauchen texanus]|uniref:chemokine XC receptor 1-like n=1 Tax=Xyrauchen texanus TaxID=154827 RepID=UPI00224237A6|nr:chemokine XC receptor 1-like [Xyrauchen texanus]
MNTTTLNFTTPQVSTNSTPDFTVLTYLGIGFYCIHFLFGLPTHSYIFWLIVTGRGSGVASEFFILNLSVCEFVDCLNSLFLVLSVWFSSLMSAAAFFEGFSLTGRPLFQCLMCVERYLAVVYPVTFLKYKPLRYRVICSTAAWTICLCSCLVCGFTMVFSSIVHMWFILIQFLLVPSLQLFCLSAVLRALKQSGPGERGREKTKDSHVKRRAFHLILITTVSMIIMYIPYTISGFLTIVTQQYINAFWLIGLICYVLAGFVQPVLYLHSTGRLSFICSP